MPTTYLIRIRELECALISLDPFDKLRTQLRLARLTEAAREVCAAPQDEVALARLRALVSPGRYDDILPRLEAGGFRQPNLLNKER